MVPPSQRCGYECDKDPTGPVDRNQLITFINTKALETPDLPENEPFELGKVRGKKVCSINHKLTFYSITGHDISLDCFYYRSSTESLRKETSNIPDGCLYCLDGNFAERFMLVLYFHDTHH